jgi:hypothetical protein
MATLEDYFRGSTSFAMGSGAHDGCLAGGPSVADGGDDSGDGYLDLDALCAEGPDYEAIPAYVAAIQRCSTGGGATSVLMDAVGELGRYSPADLTEHASWPAILAAVTEALRADLCAWGGAVTLPLLHILLRCFREACDSAPNLAADCAVSLLACLARCHEAGPAGYVAPAGGTPEPTGAVVGDSPRSLASVSNELAQLGPVMLGPLHAESGGYEWAVLLGARVGMRDGASAAAAAAFTALTYMLRQFPARGLFVFLNDESADRLMLHVLNALVVPDATWTVRGVVAGANAAVRSEGASVASPAPNTAAYPLYALPPAWALAVVACCDVPCRRAGGPNACLWTWLPTWLACGRARQTLLRFMGQTGGWAALRDHAARAASLLSALGPTQEPVGDTISGVQALRCSVVYTLHMMGALVAHADAAPLLAPAPVLAAPVTYAAISAAPRGAVCVLLRAPTIQSGGTVTSGAETSGAVTAEMQLLPWPAPLVEVAACAGTEGAAAAVSATAAGMAVLPESGTQTRVLVSVWPDAATNRRLRRLHAERPLRTGPPAGGAGAGRTLSRTYSNGGTGGGLSRVPSSSSQASDARLAPATILSPSTSFLATAEAEGVVGGGLVRASSLGRRASSMGSALGVDAQERYTLRVYKQGASTSAAAAAAVVGAATCDACSQRRHGHAAAHTVACAACAITAAMPGAQVMRTAIMVVAPALSNAPGAAAFGSGGCGHVGTVGSLRLTTADVVVGCLLHEQSQAARSAGLQLLVAGAAGQLPSTAACCASADALWRLACSPSMSLRGAFGVPSDAAGSPAALLAAAATSACESLAARHTASHPEPTAGHGRSRACCTAAALATMRAFVVAAAASVVPASAVIHVVGHLAATIAAVMVDPACEQQLASGTAQSSNCLLLGLVEVAAVLAATHTGSSALAAASPAVAAAVARHACERMAGMTMTLGPSPGHAPFHGAESTEDVDGAAWRYLQSRAGVAPLADAEAAAWRQDDWSPLRAWPPALHHLLASLAACEVAREAASDAHVHVGAAVAATGAVAGEETHTAAAVAAYAARVLALPALRQAAAANAERAAALLPALTDWEPPAAAHGSTPQPAPAAAQLLAALHARVCRDGPAAAAQLPHGVGLALRLAGGLHPLVTAEVRRALALTHKAPGQPPQP